MTHRPVVVKMTFPEFRRWYLGEMIRGLFSKEREDWDSTDYGDEQAKQYAEDPESNPDNFDQETLCDSL